MYDAIIIGAGVIGCSIAAELSRFTSNVLVIDKKCDVSEGASKANSGIIHAGYDAKPGTKKAFYNIKGAGMYEEICKKLGVPYKKNAAMVLGFDEADKRVIEDLNERAKLNGVSNCKIIQAEEIVKLEPNVNPEVKCALYVGESAIASPYELTYAYANWAAINGVSFVFDTEVRDLKYEGGSWKVFTNARDYGAKTIINCAGTGADTLHNMISKNPCKITYRRGEYYLLDHEKIPKFTHTLFQVPSKMGKGVLVAPSTHQNIILGPSADDIENLDDTRTNADILSSVLAKAAKTWPQFSMKSIITTFSGIRAHEVHDDFMVGKVEAAEEGAYEAIGIESPGLSAAPAIAQDIAKMVSEFLRLSEKTDHKEPLTLPKPFSQMSDKERQEAYLKDKNYGRIVCRCELVTEAEIRSSIRCPVGAKTIDGVKRRTRAGMGRCQGGFCTTRVAQILSEELDIPIEKVRKSSGNSEILIGNLNEYRENIDHEFPN